MLAFRIFSGCHPLLEKLDVRGKQWELFKLAFLLLPKLSIAHHQLLVEIICCFFLIASKCNRRVRQSSREYSTHLSFL